MNRVLLERDVLLKCGSGLVSAKERTWMNSCFKAQTLSSFRSEGNFLQATRALFSQPIKYMLKQSPLLKNKKIPLQIILPAPKRSSTTAITSCELSQASKSFGTKELPHEGPPQLDESGSKIYDAIIESYRTNNVDDPALFEEISMDMRKARKETLTVCKRGSEKLAIVGSLGENNFYIRKLVLMADQSGIGEVFRLVCTYGIYLYGLHGNYEQANFMIDLIQGKGMALEETNYGSLMNAYANRGDIKKTLETFELLKENTAGVEIYTYVVLMKVYAHHKKLQDCMEVIDLMKEKVPPTDLMYDNLIRHCIHHNDVRRAWAAYDKMIKDGVEPTFKTYNMLITFTQRKDGKKAKTFFEEMVGRGISPSPRMIDSLLTSLASSLVYYPESLDLLKNLKSRDDFKPTGATWKIMLYGAQANRKLKDARRFFYQIIETTQDDKIILDALRVLLLTYGHAFKIDRVERFLRPAPLPSTFNFLKTAPPSNIEKCVEEAFRVESLTLLRIQTNDLVLKQLTSRAALYNFTNYNYFNEAVDYYNLHLANSPQSCLAAIYLALLKLCSRLNKKSEFYSYLEKATALLEPVGPYSTLSPNQQSLYRHENFLNPEPLGHLYQAIITGLTSFGDLDTAMAFFEEQTRFANAKMAQHSHHYAAFFRSIKKSPNEDLRKRLAQIDPSLYLPQD